MANGTPSQTLKMSQPFQRERNWLLISVQQSLQNCKVYGSYCKLTVKNEFPLHEMNCGLAIFCWLIDYLRFIFWILHSGRLNHTQIQARSFQYRSSFINGQLSPNSWCFLMPTKLLYWCRTWIQIQQGEREGGGEGLCACTMPISI